MRNTIIGIAVMLMFFISTAFSQYHISNSVIGSGGNKTSNTNYILISTVGEPFIGKSVNAASQHNIGFWYVHKQSTLTDIVNEEEETIPTVFKLEQNYPNPFNPSTVIKFAVPEMCNVIIKIFDLLGGEVITLVNEEMEAGWYRREFNASAYSSGIYIYRMQAGNYINTKKMILIK